MANRYWVGGTGTWTAGTTTNWSATSGGAGGASVPTAADSIFFDQAGTYNVTLTGAINCLDWTVSDGSVTFVTGTSPSMSVYGNVTWAAGSVAFSGATFTWQFNAPAGGSRTISTNNVSVPGNPTTFSTGTFNLGSAFTASSNISFGSIPTLNTNNYALTCNGIGSSVTLNLGSSIVTVSGAVVFLTGTGAIVNPGTSTILCTNTSSINFSFLSSGITLNNVIFTANTGFSVSITNRNTFNNLSFTAPNFVTTKNITFGAPQTINGSLSILNTTGVAANRRTFFASSAYGLAQTLTINGNVDLIDADFRDLEIRGSRAPISGTRIGNRGNCKGITFNTPKTVYWNLAGSQNWSAAAWALTSGGTPSADNFPLPQDTAVFNNAGSVGTITLDSAMGYVGTVDMSARTSAMTLTFGTATTCYGDWKNGSGTTLSSFNALTFSGSGTQTITSAGKSFTNSITVNTYDGTVQLADSLNLGENNIQVTTGTFNTQGYTVVAGGILSNNSNVRTINLGSSTLNLIGSTQSIIFTTSTNLTFNAGTSTITAGPDAGGNWKVLDGGTGVTFYDVIIEGSPLTSSEIRGVNTFRNLTLLTRQTFTTGIVTAYSFYANQTITGTLTCAGESAIRRVFINSDIVNTQRTLTANAISAPNCDFQDIVLAGAATGASPTRAGNCGNNSGITFPAAKTVYWNLAGAQNWSATGWALTSGATPSADNFPLVQDTAVFDNTGAAGTITMERRWNIGTFDASLRTSAMTLTTSTTYSSSVYGNWKFGTGVTSTSSTGAIFFVKNGTQTITSNGVQFGCPITINNSLANVQLADALSLNSARTLTLTSGTFDAVTYNVTTGQFTNSAATNTIKMGSGIWTLSGTGTVWGVGIGILYSGTSSIVLSDTSTTARIFSGGGFYYNKLTIGGTTGTSTLSLSSGNTFGELASTKTVAHTILCQTNATTTVGKWSITGTAGNIVTVTGTGSAGTSFTLSIAGPANSGIDYLSVRDCALSTTSPGEFYVGANSTNVSNNTGAIFFTATPAPRTLYWVGGTGNWSATSSWSISSGGSSGEAIPKSLDSVIFNSASAGGTSTIDAGVTIARCAAFTMDGTRTWAGTVPIAFHGNVSIAATGITLTYSGAMFLAGNSSYTFTTNGVALSNAQTVTGIGSTWTLGSALTNANSLTVTYGNFNTSTSNYALSISAFASSNSNVRGISLNGSTVTITGAGSLLNFTTFINLTFNAGTSLMTMNSLSLTFSGGNQTFYNVSITPNTTSSALFSGANIFNNLTVTGPTTIGICLLTFSANQTINGTLTLGAGTTPSMRIGLSSDTIGTQRTFTCAAISSLTDVDFRDINFAGAITLPVTGTRLGDCKGNSNITFDAGKTVYYRQTGNANWGASPGSWSLTDGGAVVEGAFPLAQDTAVFPAATYPSSGSTVSINASYNIGTIDMSLRTTNTMTIGGSASTLSIYGNWINGSGTSFGLAASTLITFAGRTTQGITTAGKTWTASLTIETPGGSVVLQDAFVLNVGTTNINPNIKYGTFDANGYNVTMGVAGNGYTGMTSTGSNVRAINFGSGTWTFPHNGTFMTLSGSNLSISGTGTITTTNIGTTNWSPGGFNFSGMTFNLGGPGQVNFNGNCTIGTITRSYTAAAAVLSFANFTLRVGSWNVSGTAAGNLTIFGNSEVSPATLIYTGAGAVPILDYVIPTFIRAYPLTNTWSIGANSTNAGALGFAFPEIHRSLGNFMAFF